MLSGIKVLRRFFSYCVRIKNVGGKHYVLSAFVLGNLLTFFMEAVHVEIEKYLCDEINYPTSGNRVKILELTSLLLSDSRIRPFLKSRLVTSVLHYLYIQVSSRNTP